MSEIKNKLLEREVTRKEFLIYISMALLSLFGISNFLSLITGHRMPDLDRITGNSSDGFGSRRFGK